MNGVTRKHVSFRIVHFGSECHFAPFIEHYHGIHRCIFMQGFCHSDELFVLDDGVALALDGEHIASVTTRDGLITRDGLASRIKHGSANGVPVGIGNGEGFTGWLGAVENGAKLVPGRLIVEEHAGSELVAHGFKRKLVDEKKINSFGGLESSPFTKLYNSGPLVADASEHLAHIIMGSAKLGKSSVAFCTSL